MRITAPKFEAVSHFYRGLLGAGRDESQSEDESQAPTQLDALLDSVEQLEKQAREFLQMGGAAEPAIVFDAREDDAVFWGDLHVRNRRFIVDQFVRLAGVGPGRADNLATFPTLVPRGREDGEGAGSPMPMEAVPSA